MCIIDSKPLAVFAHALFSFQAPRALHADVLEMSFDPTTVPNAHTDRVYFELPGRRRFAGGFVDVQNFYSFDFFAFGGFLGQVQLSHDIAPGDLTAAHSLSFFHKPVRSI